MTVAAVCTGVKAPELDDERVLALQRFSVRGKTSGLDLRRMRGANLFHHRTSEESGDV